MLTLDLPTTTDLYKGEESAVTLQRLDLHNPKVLETQTSNIASLLSDSHIVKLYLDANTGMFCHPSAIDLAR